MRAYFSTLVSQLATSGKYRSNSKDWQGRAEPGRRGGQV